MLYFAFVGTPLPAKHLLSPNAISDLDLNTPVPIESVSCLLFPVKFIRSNYYLQLLTIQ